MSKDLPINENFYTYEEIRNFTNNFTNCNIINITAFIESKTKKSYTVVPVEFIKDVNRLFIEYEMLIVKFSTLTNDFWEAQGGDNNKVVTKEVIQKLAKLNHEIWEEVKDYDKKLFDKHKELLTKYQLVGGK